MASASAAPTRAAAAGPAAAAAAVAAPGAIAMGLAYARNRAKRLYRGLVKLWRFHVSGRHKRRAGGLVLRAAETSGEEILLINSRKNPDVWIIPAGTVERGEGLAEAALREVAEEAGVVCGVDAGGDLGTFDDDDRLVRTAVYVMRVTEDLGAWENMEFGRKRRWWALDAALKALKDRDRRPLEKYLGRAAAPRGA